MRYEDYPEGDKEFIERCAVETRTLGALVVRTFDLAQNGGAMERSGEVRELASDTIMAVLHWARSQKVDVDDLLENVEMHREDQMPNAPLADVVPIAQGTED